MSIRAGTLRESERSLCVDATTKIGPVVLL